MTWRIGTALVALAACKNAPPQEPVAEVDLCDALDAGVTAGDDYFARSQGAQRESNDPDDLRYATSLRLPGTLGCEIVHGAILHCWAPATTREAYLEYVDRTQACLRGWIAERHRDAPRMIFTRDDAGEVEITAELDLWSDGSMHVLVRAERRSEREGGRKYERPEKLSPSRPSMRRRFH